MQRQIVRSMIERQRALRVVAEFDSPLTSVAAIESADADLVLFGSEQATIDPIYDAWLTKDPRRAAVQLTANGRHAYLWHLCAQRDDLGEVSQERLLELLRQSARGAGRIRRSLDWLRRR
jgi:hypothetical protein